MDNNTPKSSNQATSVQTLSDTTGVSNIAPRQRRPPGWKRPQPRGRGW